MVVMRFLVNCEYQATDLFAIKHNAVGFTFGIIDGFLNSCARNDFAVIVNMIVTLTELYQRTILERPLIIKDELLTVVCRKRNKLKEIKMSENYYILYIQESPLL